MSEIILPPPVSSESEDIILHGWSYAGFSKRGLAFSIDQTLILVIVSILSLPAAVLLIFMQFLAWPFAVFVIAPSLSSFTVGIGWMYCALQESSKHQATFGKRICGLRVIDIEGRRITLGRASVRYFGKILSAALMMLGFVMAAFTERHQALHDLIAETLVMQKASS